MSKTVYPFDPDYNVHPGRILKMILKTNNRTIKDFSIESDLTVHEIKSIIDEVRSIDQELANCLGLYTGISSQAWLNLQELYNTRKTKKSP